MKPGTKPAPSRLLKLRGTYRKDRRPQNEVELKPGIPSAPRWLNKEARAEWKRVVAAIGDKGVLSPADRGVFVQFCMTWSNYVKAEFAVEEQGTTFIDDKGNRRKNPSLAVLNETRAAYLRLAEQMGLTPSARTRIKTLEKPTEQDPLEELLERKPGPGA